MHFRFLLLLLLLTPRLAQADEKCGKNQHWDQVVERCVGEQTRDDPYNDPYLEKLRNYDGFIPYKASGDKPGQFTGKIPEAKAREIFERHEKELEDIVGRDHTNGIGLGVDGIHIGTRAPLDPKITVPEEVEGIPVIVDPPSVIELL